MTQIMGNKKAIKVYQIVIKAYQKVIKALQKVIKAFQTVIKDFQKVIKEVIPLYTAHPQRETTMPKNIESHVRVQVYRH